MIVRPPYELSWGGAAELGAGLRLSPGAFLLFSTLYHNFTRISSEFTGMSSEFTGKSP